jgi:DNA-binding beta-propeller fold protein YncE
MLHATPFCMGIAHERDNVYWTVNGQRGALDRYDFREPHLIGGEDHSDGEITRYVSGQVARVPEIPSHLALDSARGELYVADTGNGRVARLDIDSGVPGADVPVYEPMPVHRLMDGATFEDVVPPGVLTLPSGVAFADDKLLVTDNATSKLWWFERSGAVLGSLDTGLPPGSLGGVTVGPDGKAYVSDLKLGTAYRVEPR